MPSFRPVRWRTIAAVALAAMISLVVAPLPASALSLSAPANVLDRVDASASLTASDAGGLVMLLLDERVVRSVPASDGPRTVTFPGLPLVAGAHRLRVVVRGADGLFSTPRRDVVSWRPPVPPVLVSPTNGYGSKVTNIIMKAGPGTTSLKLTLNGKYVCMRWVSPGQLVNLGPVTLAAGLNTAVVQAANPVSSASGTFKIRRLDFPWSTCIVVDKSEFRLYWVKDGVLVKTYPVAIGRPSLETPCHDWRIDAKYVTDWGSVYGPRKMRLFKEVGPGSFVYTNYGIHGTNQEWVIGTKASHGCIRMYNRDVLELYPQVPLHTMVRTQE